MVQNKVNTIHTSRTIMYTELSKVMDYAVAEDKYDFSMNENIINKRTKTNLSRTNKYLKKLYGFDINSEIFKAFKFFWQITNSKEKPLLSFIYALGKDSLLFESMDIVLQTQIGDKVKVEKIANCIDNNHTDKYSNNTLRSLSQNIASSWKQAGYIQGKVKNIRAKTSPSYYIVAFAFFLSYLHGDRGEFILNSKWARVLDLSKSALREMAYEAAKHDLLHYQYSGGVTVITFNTLIRKLNINDI